MIAVRPRLVCRSTLAPRFSSSHLPQHHLQLGWPQAAAICEQGEGRHTLRPCASLKFNFDEIQ